MAMLGIRAFVGRSGRTQKDPPAGWRVSLRACVWDAACLRGLLCAERGDLLRPYFGGAGVNPSRLRPGSGLGFGFGAFLTSFLPLSLLPMDASVTQKGAEGKDKNRCQGVNEMVYCPYFVNRPPIREGSTMTGLPGVNLPRTSFRVVMAMLGMIAVPAALTLHTVRGPASGSSSALDSSPYGYTVSLSLFIVPIL